MAPLYTSIAVTATWNILLPALWARIGARNRRCDNSIAQLFSGIFGAFISSGCRVAEKRRMVLPVMAAMTVLLWPATAVPTLSALLLQCHRDILIEPLVENFSGFDLYRLGSVCALLF